MPVKSPLLVLLYSMHKPKSLPQLGGGVEPNDLSQMYGVNIASILIKTVTIMTHMHSVQNFVPIELALLLFFVVLTAYLAIVNRPSRFKSGRTIHGPICL